MISLNVFWLTFWYLQIKHSEIFKVNKTGGILSYFKMKLKWIAKWTNYNGFFQFWAELDGHETESAAN